MSNWTNWMWMNGVNLLRTGTITAHECFNLKLLQNNMFWLVLRWADDINAGLTKRVTTFFSIFVGRGDCRALVIAKIYTCGQYPGRCSIELINDFFGYELVSCKSTILMSQQFVLSTPTRMPTAGLPIVRVSAALEMRLQTNQVTSQSAAWLR